MFSLLDFYTIILLLIKVSSSEMYFSLLELSCIVFVLFFVDHKDSLFQLDDLDITEINLTLFAVTALLLLFIKLSLFVDKVSYFGRQREVFPMHLTLSSKFRLRLLFDFFYVYFQKFLLSYSAFFCGDTSSFRLIEVRTGERGTVEAFYISLLGRNSYFISFSFFYWYYYQMAKILLSLALNSLCLTA